MLVEESFMIWPRVGPLRDMVYQTEENDNPKTLAALGLARSPGFVSPVQPFPGVPDQSDIGDPKRGPSYVQQEIRDSWNDQRLRRGRDSRHHALVLDRAYLFSAPAGTIEVDQLIPVSALDEIVVTVKR